MKCKQLTRLALFLCIGCGDVQIKHAAFTSTTPARYQKINQLPLPAGYSRLQYPNGSFANWLQQLPLKKDKTVYLYNGIKKANQAAQFAVLDISVGNQNLQQCADAVMRLRAEYLFEHKKFDRIIFFDNNRKAYPFTTPFTRAHFDKYLLLVFGICGSASLEKQLRQQKMQDINPGDVLIKGGFPGHAVIVTDVAINNKANKIFMIAQSYMPAQDIHVLVNPANPQFPWYTAGTAKLIITPEYVFDAANLKSW
ncbi:MAG: hypothetical protein RL172_2820 [Bacteroidota bacterium]|jgi:hypothetical protein